MLNGLPLLSRVASSAVVSIASYDVEEAVGEDFEKALDEGNVNLDSASESEM